MQPATRSDIGRSPLLVGCEGTLVHCSLSSKKDGILLSSQESIVTPSSEGTSLESRVSELTAELKRMEFEKREAEYNLNRRNADYTGLSTSLDEMKGTLEQTRKALETNQSKIHDMETSLSAIRNHVTSLFISMAQFIDADGEKEDEVKASVYASVRQIFPQNSAEGEADLVLLNTVDKVSLLKSRHHTLQKELQAKTSLLDSQSRQISDLLSLTENDKATIARLQSPVASQTSSDASPRLAELEAANDSLRQALQSMRETLARQQAAAETNEERVVKTQQELVAVQQSSNEMVQQLFAANEEQMKQLEADKAKLQTIAEKATEEAAKLRATLEQATREYESELATLRERRDAVQEQVSVSEKFIDSANRAHREELNKLTQAKQEAQRAQQETRMQLMEKEEELRTCTETLESVKEESREQVRKLTAQLREVEQRMIEETAKVESERRSLQQNEGRIDAMVAERVGVVEQKAREASRLQQRQYEEEVNEEATADD